MVIVYKCKTLRAKQRAIFFAEREWDLKRISRRANNIFIRAGLKIEIGPFGSYFQVVTNAQPSRGSGISRNNGIFSLNQTINQVIQELNLRLMVAQQEIILQHHNAHHDRVEEHNIDPLPPIIEKYLNEEENPGIELPVEENVIPDRQENLIKTLIKPYNPSFLQNNDTDSDMDI